MWRRSSSPTACWRSPLWRATSTPTRTARPTASDVTLFTMQIGVYDPNLADFLTDHGVEFRNPYVPEMSPILEFMLTYILPTVLMVGLPSCCL